MQRTFTRNTSVQSSEKSEDWTTDNSCQDSQSSTTNLPESQRNEGRNDVNGRNDQNDQIGQNDQNQSDQTNQNLTENFTNLSLTAQNFRSAGYTQNNSFDDLKNAFIEIYKKDFKIYDQSMLIRQLSILQWKALDEGLGYPIVGGGLCFSGKIYRVV